MKLSEFDYKLPKELIAQIPIKKRDFSNLLILDKNNGNIEDKKFYNILDYLGENDVLVLNNSRVINARLKGFIENSNILCEVFLHKKILENKWDCLVYPGKKLKVGTIINIGENLKAKIVSISDKGRIVEFNKSGKEFIDIVDKVGQVPLPPYIKENLSIMDRYQTVYNDKIGSVAAPTAGLHFTNELIEKLEKKGVIIEKVLLHVGLGTFANVETENIADHKMHFEYIELDEKTSIRLNKYKKEAKRIIAVGTTSVRVLESFCKNNKELDYGSKETNIFIYPSYKRKFVDSIITNFHIPKSTLLMLVSSFAGKENIKKAYNHAISKKYKFFSFGDAMRIK